MDDSGNAKNTGIDEIGSWNLEEAYASLWAPHNDEGPVIVAAGLRDPSRLSLLLERAQRLNQKARSKIVLDYTPEPGSEWGMEQPTPLLRAIERCRPKNVQLLLRHGADPNGVLLETQIQLARIHRRFTTRPDRHPAVLCNDITMGEVGTVASQFIPITEGERKERRSTVCRFWMEPHQDGIDYSSESAQLHSVVRAGASTMEVLDILLDDDRVSNRSNADASFWKDSVTLDSLPEELDLTPSSIAISTPLHSAIAFGRIDMLQGLLSRGFNPNARAMITGSLALTPAQYAITIGNYDAYDNLKKHRSVDLGIRTPTFGVHLLHFAVALLSQESLQRVGLPLSDAAKTSLGHSLLHIACLPYRAEEIAYTPKVQESIHETRNLHDTQFRRFSLDNVSYDSDGKKIRPTYNERDGGPRDIPDELHRQEAICKRIIAELGFYAVGQEDSYGNTALHYLAGSWYLNKSLIAELRSWTPGEFAWQNDTNMWGHTPKDLMEENLAMRNDTVQTSGRGFIVSRAMKQNVVLRGRR